jgi:LacI family transcriptional regulator
MATLQEIAQRANVSTGTVDRVVHNRGRVSESTRQKIQRLVKELDYRPNILARNLSLKKTYIFGILLPFPKQDGSYWELPVAGIQKALNELKMYHVTTATYHYDKYSEGSFRQACLDIISRLESLDGLVIAPVLSRASEQFISRLPGSFPYIFIDSYIHESHCLSYIGQESFQSGVLAGKLMSMSAPQGKVIVFRVLPEDYHIEDRVAGFRSVIQNIDKYSVCVYDVNRETDAQIFKGISEKMISEHEYISGIFVPSACTHQVAEVLVQHDRYKDAVLIGYDLVEENKKYLKSGVIKFLISQRPALQGYQGIYSLYRHVILREPVEKKVIVPMDILTQDNVDYYQG